MTATVIATAAGALGCYDTPAPACAFECGDRGQCPQGYACGPDRWCKRADLAPTYDCGSDLSVPDAGPASVTR